MTVKVTVKTDDFEVELPTTMLVRDRYSDEEIRMEISGYDPCVTYSWRMSNDGYKLARPIPKPKMIPWTIEDFKVGMVVRSIQNPKNTFLVIGVHTSVQVGQENYTLDDMLEYYTQEDSTPFEKEA